MRGRPIGTLVAVIVTIHLTALISLAAAQSKEPNPATGSISGVVTRDGKPAPDVGVVVALLRDDGTFGKKAVERVITGEKGRFEFIGLSKGTYVIDAHLPGASVRDETPWDGAVRTTIGDGESVDNVSIVLESGGVITGKLTDESGKPICGETIVLYVLRPDGSRENIGTDASALGTDDRGIYRIYGLSSGKYVVGAGTDDIQSSHRGRWMPAIDRTYHGGATRLADAKLIEIAPGTEARDIDIVVTRGRAGVAIAGSVIDAVSRKPLAGVTVGIGPIINGELLGLSLSDITTGDGSFRIQGVRPGRRGLLAATVGTELGGYYSPVQEINVADRGLESVVIELRRGATVTGVVTVAPTESNAPISLDDSRFLMLEPVRGTGAVPVDLDWHARELRVLPDGSFKAEGVLPGDYRIVANPTPSSRGAFVARVEVDGVETQQPIRAVGDETIDNVRVLLGFGSAVIRGNLKLVHGTVAPNRIGVRLSRAVEETPMRTTAVDDGGTFVFEGVPSGDFVVTAFAYIDDNSRVHSRPVPVSTQSHGTATVTIELDLKPESASGGAQR